MTIDRPPLRASLAASLPLGCRMALAREPARGDTVSERRLRGGYAPQVAWANIKCQTAPGLGVRLGRITPRPRSNGSFINVQPAFRSGRPIAVLSAALDFVH